MSSSLAQALLSSLPENLRAQASGAADLGATGDLGADAAGAPRSGGGDAKRVRGSSMIVPAGSFDLGDPMGVSYSTYAPLGHGGRRQSIGARDSFYLHDGGGGSGGAGGGFSSLHRRASEDVRPSGIDLGFGGGGGSGSGGVTSLGRPTALSDAGHAMIPRMDGGVDRARVNSDAVDLHSWSRPMRAASGADGVGLVQPSPMLRGRQPSMAGDSWLPGVGGRSHAAHGGVGAQQDGRASGRRTGDAQHERDAGARDDDEEEEEDDDDDGSGALLSRKRARLVLTAHEYSDDDVSDDENLGSGSAIRISFSYGQVTDGGLVATEMPVSFMVRWGLVHSAEAAAAVVPPSPVAVVAAEESRRNRGGRAVRSFAEDETNDGDEDEDGDEEEEVTHHPAARRARPPRDRSSDKGRARSGGASKNKMAAARRAIAAPSAGGVSTGSFQGRFFVDGSNPVVTHTMHVGPFELPVVPELLGWVGAYPFDNRCRRIERFVLKRRERIWEKVVKYDVRKSFADQRLRVKGRFVKKEDENVLRDFLQLY